MVGSLGNKGILEKINRLKRRYLTLQILMDGGGSYNFHLQKFKQKPDTAPQIKKFADTLLNL
jgi:hypothetical protein